MNAIQTKISSAVALTLPRTAARNKSLKSIRWVLASPNGFASVSPSAKAFLVQDISEAQVFDGRDNEELKASFFSAILKVPFEAVLLP